MNLKLGLKELRSSRADSVMASVHRLWHLASKLLPSRCLVLVVTRDKNERHERVACLLQGLLRMGPDGLELDDVLALAGRHDDALSSSRGG